MSAYDVIERKLRADMVQGQMHTTLRDIGRLAGGYAAANRLTGGEIDALEGVAISLSKNKRLGRDTWRDAVSYGRTQPLRDERRDDDAFGWEDRVSIVGRHAIAKATPPEDEAPSIVDERWIETEELPAPAAD